MQSIAAYCIFVWLVTSDIFISLFLPLFSSFPPSLSLLFSLPPPSLPLSPSSFLSLLFSLPPSLPLSPSSSLFLLLLFLLIQSLDHQGITFKATDTRAMRSKSLIGEIETTFDERQEQLSEGASTAGPHLQFMFPVREGREGGGGKGRSKRTLKSKGKVYLVSFPVLFLNKSTG